MKKNILFRVDYNKTIGYGHLSRCLNLASLFIKYGHNVLIICKSNEKKIPLKYSNKINFIHLKKKISINKDSEFLLKIFKEKNIDYLILDMEHKINKKKIYEKFLSKIKTILNKTICWDDTVTNKYIFLQTYRPYPNFINLEKLKKKQKTLTGLQNMYFANYKKKSKVQKKKIKNILIFLSATDQKKKLIKIVYQLNNFKINYKLNFIILNCKKNNFFKNIKKKHNFYFKKIIDVNHLYQNIDIAIVGGGMIKYECMMNLIPSIIVNLNPRQKKININIEKYKLGMIVENLDLLKEKLKKLITDINFRTKIVNNCLNIRKKYNEKKLMSALLNL